MATISFYVDPAAGASGATGTQIGGGSGLGFYGDAGFGASVAVGAYQGRTFITNSTGTAQGAQGDNIKYLNAGSGIFGQTGSGIGVDAWPFTQASLMVKFSHSSTVRVQNAEIRIYDRSNIANAASGVTTKMAEICHPWSTQTPVTTGSGVNDGRWYTPAGSSATMSLSPSPGPTGLFVGDGSSTYSSTVHDWFLGISASPDSIGSKTKYGLYMSLEYL